MDIDDFVTAAGRWETCRPMPHGPWQPALEAYLLDLASGLRDAGCVIIGHIKGMLDGAGGPPLFFSLTSFSGPPHFRGGSPGEKEAQDMSINVIVAGIDQAEARRILEATLYRHFRTPGV